MKVVQYILCKDTKFTFYLSYQNHLSYFVSCFYEKLLPMQFKKIYIEITNVCNFHCSFCVDTTRTKKFMPTDDFRFIAQKVKSVTDYVYLHVLGEPLLHPQLNEILKICTENKLHVNISTNGSLLKKQWNALNQNSVRQLNISLHDAEENIAKEKWSDFITEMLDISKQLSSKTYINLRLWNQTNASSVVFNELCYCLMRDFYHLPPDFNFLSKDGRNITLAHNVFLQNAPRFEWQTRNAMENKTCYALKDHIAVLANGDVVPCCIDADANLLLGNIFVNDLVTIIQSDKAVRIKNGFAKHKAVEDFCKKCGFRV